MTRVQSRMMECMAVGGAVGSIVFTLEILAGAAIVPFRWTALGMAFAALLDWGTRPPDAQNGGQDG